MLVHTEKAVHVGLAHSCSRRIHFLIDKGWDTNCCPHQESRNIKNVSAGTVGSVGCMNIMNSVSRSKMDWALRGNPNDVQVLSLWLPHCITATEDEIICLREGHVVERGSSKELMEQRGYFFTLVEKQAAPWQMEFEWYGPDTMYLILCNWCSCFLSLALMEFDIIRVPSVWYRFRWSMLAFECFWYVCLMSLVSSVTSQKGPQSLWGNSWRYWWS